jgi:hypothetical protein
MEVLAASKGSHLQRDFQAQLSEVSIGSQQSLNWPAQGNSFYGLGD